MEAIVDARGSGDSLEYEVAWAKHQATSWEPAENLVGATEALREFERKRGKAK